MTDAPSLTLRTLRLTRGPSAPRWVEPAAFHLDPCIATHSAPMIGLLRSSDGERVGGRFFPSVPIADPRGLGLTGHVSAVLVYEHNDPEVTRATVVHELCHWLSYCQACPSGAPPDTKRDASLCRYKGEHSPEFYDRLEGLYRACGVPLYAARIVEGDYDFPAHWRVGERWGAR